MNTQSQVSSHLTSSIQRTRCRRTATPEPGAGLRCHWLLRGPNAVNWRLRVAVQSTRSSVARRYRGSGDARRCATRPPRARPRVSIHRGHRPARRRLYQPVVRAGGQQCPNKRHASQPATGTVAVVHSSVRNPPEHPGVAKSHLGDGLLVAPPPTLARGALHHDGADCLLLSLCARRSDDNRRCSGIARPPVSVRDLQLSGLRDCHGDRGKRDSPRRQGTHVESNSSLT